LNHENAKQVESLWRRIHSENSELIECERTETNASTVKTVEQYKVNWESNQYHIADGTQRIHQRSYCQIGTVILQQTQRNVWIAHQQNIAAVQSLEEASQWLSEPEVSINQVNYKAEYFNHRSL